MEKNTAALIAAAGLSSRMGSFKPLLPLGDKATLEHVIDNFRMAGVDHVVVVTGYKADALMPLSRKKNVVALHNPDYETSGMFESILIGLTHLKDKCRAIYIQPGDMPCIQPETIRRLWDAMRESGADVAHPSYLGKKHGHPVLFSAGTVDALLAHDGTEGLRGAIRTITGTKIDVAVDDSGIMLDMDRLEHYQNLLARFHDNNIPSTVYGISNSTDTPYNTKASGPRPVETRDETRIDQPHIHYRHRHDRREPGGIVHRQRLSRDHTGH